MAEYESWLRQTVEQHNRDLYHGNGKPGVTTRLQSLEDRVTQHERNWEEFKDGQKWIIRLLVGLIVAALANLVLNHPK